RPRGPGLTVSGGTVRRPPPLATARPCTAVPGAAAFAPEPIGSPDADLLAPALAVVLVQVLACRGWDSASARSHTGSGHRHTQPSGLGKSVATGAVARDVAGGAVLAGPRPVS